jgi:formylglycine-generating enzyme required for sulfatase activity
MGCGCWTSIFLAISFIGCQRDAITNNPPARNSLPPARADSFDGSKDGDEREGAGVKLCGCPPGRFIMGSPPNEPERRPGEDQVEERPSLGKAAKVGSYPANAWGLHDMHGNTFEGCRDWYHANLPGGVAPDLYSAKGTAQRNRTGDFSRVRRGGAWDDDGWPCRSAFRLRFEPERRYDHSGSYRRTSPRCMNL